MKDVLVDPASPPLSDPIDAAIHRLRNAGLRVTQPRIALLKALIDTGEPVTIERLHAMLDDEACDLVTVYRCLCAFEKAGLVRRTFTNNGTSLLEFVSGQAPNYYVICRETNRMARIGNFDVEMLDYVIDQIKTGLAAQGYADITHSLQFFAVAPSVTVTALDEPARAQ